MEENKAYDSSADSKAHIKIVQTLMNDIIIHELKLRAKNHDASKLESPEKEMYDKYIPLLRNAKYGSPEYYRIKKEMAEGALSHHFMVNAHHPEYHNGDFSNMSLIDIVEMFVDWVSASSRSDAPFLDGLKMNVSTHNVPDVLHSIFENTYVQFFNGVEKK